MPIKPSPPPNPMSSTTPLQPGNRAAKSSGGPLSSTVHAGASRSNAAARRGHAAARAETAGAGVGWPVRRRAVHPHHYYRRWRPPVVEHQRLPVIASLLAIGSGVVWSIGAVLSRSATQADAFQYPAVALGGCGGGDRTSGRPPPPAVPHLPLVDQQRPMMVANIGLFLASLCFVCAVKTTTAANAAFLSSLTPLVASVFARFMGERLSRSTLVALATGSSG
ncbi:MAG: DMT family transporter [Ilumatobacteraceae bacterium]